MNRLGHYKTLQNETLGMQGAKGKPVTWFDVDMPAKCWNSSNLCDRVTGTMMFTSFLN